MPAVMPPVNKISRWLHSKGMGSQPYLWRAVLPQSMFPCAAIGVCNSHWFVLFPIAIQTHILQLGLRSKSVPCGKGFKWGSGCLEVLGSSSPQVHRQLLPCAEYASQYTSSHPRKCGQICKQTADDAANSALSRWRSAVISSNETFSKDQQEKSQHKQRSGRRLNYLENYLQLVRRRELLTNSTKR